MATDLSACRPGDGLKVEVWNRLPGSAEPLLQIDLEPELQQLWLVEAWQRETGRSSKTLAKYPDSRIVPILMKAGTQMRQHRAEGRISIQQLKGQVCIHLAHRNVNLSAGHLSTPGLRRTARRRSARGRRLATDHLLAEREE